MTGHLPITVLIAARNEEANIGRCLKSCHPAHQIIVVDSASVDSTADIARSFSAKVVNFTYHGGYPKKRQWALDSLEIDTPWVLLLDADEVMPDQLWHEIETAISNESSHSGYLITKGFHFLGKRFRFGGFSFPALILARTGQFRFEELLHDDSDGLDIEVHERVICHGTVGRLRTPLIHHDFKGLAAYIAKHNAYSTWEAKLRYQLLTTGTYGQSTIAPRLFGNSQERRRFLKCIACRTPGESYLWFIYHYFIMFGFLEGYTGLIAARLRSDYIAAARAKVYEMQVADKSTKQGQS